MLMRCRGLVDEDINVKKCEKVIEDFLGKLLLLMEKI